MIFSRSIEISLINCKIELKLKWKKHCFIAVSVNGSTNDSPNKIIITISDTKLYASVVKLCAKDNQKLSKILSKGFEELVDCNEYKTKIENRTITND